MLRGDLVREIVARKERREGVGPFQTPSEGAQRGRSIHFRMTRFRIARGSGP